MSKQQLLTEYYTARQMAHRYEGTIYGPGWAKKLHKAFHDCLRAGVAV